MQLFRNELHNNYWTKIHTFQVGGFPVYGTAQPTENALKACIEKLQGAKCKDVEADQPASTKLIWYNMRQEPVIYINGTPYAPRDPERFLFLSLII